MIKNRQVITNVDSLQQKLYLPLAWARPIARDGRVLEFREIAGGIVALDPVAVASPASSKRYKVVEHNGSAWVSVPRSWLYGRNAKNGDVLVLFGENDNTSLYLRIDRAEV